MRWGALLAMGFGPWVCLASPPAGDVGDVHVDRTAIDFGVLGKNEERERTLYVCNRTEQPIRLLGTDSDCTCLDSEVELRTLPPGGTTAWQIRLHTCDYSGETHRHVSLRTSCPDAKVVEVAVRYRVVPELFAEPGLVGLGLLPSDTTDSVETVLRVRTPTDETYHLLEAWSNDSAVDAIVERELVTRAEPGSVRVQVWLPVPEGRYQPTVWVATDSPDVAQLRIPLVGESLAGVQCDEREIVFDNVVLGESRSTTAIVSHGAGVRIGEIRKSDAGIEIGEVKRLPGRTAVTLRTRPHLRLGDFRGYLTAIVHNGHSRKIKLPYCGNVIERNPPTPLGARRDLERAAKAGEIASGSGGG